MTNDQLVVIRERCEAAQWTLTPSSQISTCNAIADIPLLLAEVERLRELVEFAYCEGYEDSKDFEQHWSNSASRARLEESK
jgi:hypothetical protein